MYIQPRGVTITARKKHMSQKQELSHALRELRELEGKEATQENRLALLLAEEQRSWEKLCKTKARTAEVLSIRDRNENRTFESLLQQPKPSDALVLSSAVQNQRKAQNERLLETKREWVRKQKQNSQKLNEEKQFIRNKHLEHAKASKDAITKQKKDNADKTSEDKASKAKQNRGLYSDSLNSKLVETQEKEEAVSQLEKEEIELINKLSQTQNKVLEAYQALTLYN